MPFVDLEVGSKGFVDADEVYGPEFNRPANLDQEAILEENETPEVASARIGNQARTTFQGKAIEAINSKNNVTDTAETIRDGEDKLFGLYSSDDLYLEDDIVSRSPQYSAAEQKFYRNMQILSEEIEVAAAEQEDKGFLGYGMDFVDRELFRATIFGGYEGLSNRTAREGSRVFGALTSTASAKEMRQFAKDYVEDIRSEGILKGENVFAYQQMLSEVYGKGYNPDANWDKFFGVLDSAALVGSVAKAAKVTRLTKLASLKSTTAATRAGALAGPEEATKVATKLHTKEINPVNTANMQSSAVDLNSGVVRPSVSRGQKIKDTDRILQTVLPDEASGAVPTARKLVDIEALKEAAAKRFTSAFKANLHDTRLVDIDTQSVGVEFLVGTTKEGSPFKALKNGEAPAAAKKIADRVGGEVVPVNPADLTQGYLVSAKEALDLSEGFKKGFDYKLAQTKWTQLLGKIFDNPFLGSSAARDVSELNRIALVSEDAAKYLQNTGIKEKAKIEKLSYKDNTMLDSILQELRDGPDSQLRQNWSETEVQAIWKTRTGEDMPEAVLDAYHAAEALSDSAYYFQATEIMKTYISKNFKNSVDMGDGIMRPARKTTLSKLKEGDKVYDARNKVKLFAEEFDDVPSDSVVWELSSEANGQSYVIFPTQTKIISYNDVLGYSAYGRRTNPLANYFVFLQGTNGELKTVLSAFTEKSVQTAVSELKAIQKVYRAEGVTDDAIEAVLRENNTFNPELVDRADLDNWLLENNIDLTDGDVLSKLRDEPVASAFDKVFDGESASDYVNNAFARSDTPIPEYGGGSSYNPSPLSSITEQFGSASHRYATSVYTARSMQGWLEQLRLMESEGINLGINLGQGNDFRQVFLSTEITGSSPAAARMREIQSIIKRRHGMTTGLEQQMDRVMTGVTEQLYDNLGWRVDMSGTEATLLKTGFFSAFGFNLSQVFLQSSQVLNTSAIVGYDVASRSLVGSSLLRNIMFNADDVAVESLGLSRLSKAIGLSAQDTQDLAVLFRQKLPNVVMGDLGDLGTGLRTGKSKGVELGQAAFTAKKVGKVLWDQGLKPFNFGESTAKSNAFVAAALEYKKKFPNSSLLSPEARQAIAARTETLTQNMSTTSKSALQTGVGKVPTQWLNYFFRTMEQVFVGRDLTGLERAKLGFAVMPFYGFTGMGAGMAAETVAEWFGLDPNDDGDKALFITLKYGLLDGFLNHFTPFEVALSERMAVLPAIYDIYDKFTEESVVASFGGPSGSIAYTGVEALFNLTSSITKGQTSTLTEDSLRVLKNFSGINNVAKAVGIVNDGVYRNRKGLAVPVEVDITDALISLGGFTPITVVEYYGQSGRAYNLTKDYKAVQKEILNKSKLAWSIYPKDPQRASEILEEATTLVSKSPLSYDRKTQLLRLLTPKVDNMDYILQTLYDNDKEYAARWALSIQKKD